MNLIQKSIFKLKSEQHLRTVGITFVIQIISAVLGFGLQILIARNVSTETYGELGILINYGTTLSFFVLFGVNTYVLRKISTLDIAENKEEISKLYFDSIFFVLSNSAITFVFLLLVHLVVPITIIDMSLSNVLIFIGFTLSLAAIFLLQNIDRALGYMIRSIAPTSIFKSLIIMAIFILILNLNVEINVQTLFFLYVVSSLLLSFYYLVKQIPLLNFNLSESRVGYKRLFISSKDYFVNRISHNFLKSLDLIFIDLLLTSFDAGVFLASLRIRIIIMFGLNAMNVVFSPDIAKLYKEGKIGELNEIIKKANYLIFAFSLLFVMGVLLFSKSILSVFGNDYIEGSTVLIIICLANLVEATFGMTGSILNMTGNQRYYNKVIFLLLFLYVISAPIFLNLWGLLGSAVLILSITLVKNILEWKYIYSKLKIKTGIISNII